MNNQTDLPIRGNNPYTQSIHEHSDLIWMDGTPPAGKLESFLSDGAPVVLDLGCGAGNFLRDSALKFPEERFIGFELRYKRLVLGARKMKKWGIKNVRLSKMRAEKLGEWIKPQSLDRVHVNFPDPWPKTRHRKHRMIQAPFLAELQKMLKSSGVFQFKTDHREYFESSLELLKETPYFEVIELSWDLHQSEYKDDNVYTEFERLFLSKGMPVYHLKARPCYPEKSI